MSKPTQKTFDEAPQGVHMTFDVGTCVPAHQTSDARVNGNGHLVVGAFLSRPGVFEYLASEIAPQWADCPEVQALPRDTVLKAYRPPAEVTKDEYLESFSLLPITDGHPPKMLHPDSVRGYPLGTSGESVTIKDGKPFARLTLWDKAAIEAYYAGKKEISIGAYNRFVWGPGKTEDGEEYHFQILDTRGNHIAMVDRGRAGHGVRIMDTKTVGMKGKRTMKTVINGVTFDIDDQAAEALVQERKSHKATVDTLTGERDAAKGKTLTDAEIDALVDKRLEQREAAKAAAALRQAVKDAGYEVEGKSDEYVQGIASTLDIKATPDGEEKRTIDTGVSISAKGPKGSGTADTQAAVQAAKRRQYGR
jgi:hypothetical protein